MLLQNQQSYETLPLGPLVSVRRSSDLTARPANIQRVSSSFVPVVCALRVDLGRTGFLWRILFYLLPAVLDLARCLLFPLSLSLPLGPRPEAHGGRDYFHSRRRSPPIKALVADRLVVVCVCSGGRSRGSGESVS